MTTTGTAVRRTGRPRVGKRVTVRLPESLLALLDRWASERQVSRANAVRLLLEQALVPAGGGQ